jgi:hypothetical protein
MHSVPHIGLPGEAWARRLSNAIDLHFVIASPNFSGMSFAVPLFPAFLQAIARARLFEIGISTNVMGRK